MIKKIFVLLGSVTIFNFISTGVFAGPTINNVTKLHWHDPFGRSPLTYEVYREQAGAPQPLKSRKLYESCAYQTSANSDSRQAPEVLIIINDRVSTLISWHLNRYVSDLENEGYSVIVESITGGSSNSIKSLIQSHFGPDLNGVVFIGSIPLAWYELDGEEFPIDLYFMDLDGTWIDNDSDGKFDQHTGSVSPEIWVARLDASHVTWDYEISLLAGYFDKNHTYRVSGLGVPARALAFNDDDWPYSSVGLEAIYSDVTNIFQYDQTTASEYQSRLETGYEWIHIMAHSCPWAHTFRNGYNSYAGCFFNEDLEVMDPQALFYQLFACSNTRFIEMDNIATMYVFRPDRGLAVVGSAKTGSMLDFEMFYTPLGDGKSIGQAFLEWFQYEALGGFSFSEQAWFYGMNILGDPTLKPSETKNDKRSGALNNDTFTATDSNKYFEIPVSTCIYSDVHPSIVGAENNTFWTVWQSGIHGRSSVCVSEFNGTNWSSQFDISNHEYWEENPFLLRNGSELFAFFGGLDSSTGTHNIKLSTNSGSGWSTTQWVQTGSGYDVRPTAEIKDSTIFLFWENWRDGESNIYLSTRPASGGSWSGVTSLTSNNDQDQFPLSALDGQDMLHLFWCRKQQLENWKLVVRPYTGWTWEAPIVLSQPEEDAFDPTVTTDIDGNIWLAYVSGSSAGLCIKTIFGSYDTWSSPVTIPASINVARGPTLATHPSGVFLAFWKQENDTRTIWITKNEGYGWASPIEIVSSSGFDWNPSLAVNDNNMLYLAWTSTRNGPGNTDIFSKQIDPNLPFQVPTINNISLFLLILMLSVSLKIVPLKRSDISCG